MLLGQVLGSVGLVLLLSTVLTFIIAGSSTFLIYFKLLLGVGFIVTYFVTNREQSKKMLGNRSMALLALSIGSGAFFLVLVSAVNYIAYKNNKEYDLTREGVFTLSDQTVKTLEGLKDEVKVLGFYRSDEPQYRQAKDILERYQLKSSKLTFEFIDPVQKPELVERHQIKEGSSRLVFTAKNSNEAKPKDLSEQELTNALVKITSSSQKKVYFLMGHGEPSLEEQDPEGYGQIATALRNEGYNVDSFSFLGQGDLQAGAKVGLADGADAASSGELKVPADAALVIVAGAKTPVSSVEIDTLSKWAQKGGKLFIALEPRRETGLEKLAAAWHVDVRNDLVVDTNPINRVLGMGPAMALVQTYESHPITKDFRQPIALPTSRSLDIKDDGANRIAGVKAQSLARSSKTSWGETDYAAGTAEFNQGKDVQGPFALITASTKEVKDEDKISDEARVIISGDGEFINNKFAQAQANGDFFINSVNWLANDEGKISIRPKQRGASRIMLTENEAAVIKFFSIDILPVALFATGMAIRQVRRRK
jgi:ABC-type uncharacterized transport system involved in gliding motility auxiliary subunit